MKDLHSDPLPIKVRVMQREHMPNGSWGGWYQLKTGVILKRTHTHAQVFNPEDDKFAGPQWAEWFAFEAPACVVRAA